MLPRMPAPARWWHGATIYQIYPRSFADSDGDGVGDLRGIIERLDYVGSLGVDVVWISPFFASPQADFGYDVSDYCAVAPEYGTLADAEELFAEIHQRGMRVMLDLVLNHTSDQHPWFVESRSSRNNPRADWYVWADGDGPGRPPNNWRSALEVRPAWQWCPRREQWFLATFLPFQPDLNWHNPDVKAAMCDVLRFWLRRGVDGFRLDIFGSIMHDAALRDAPVWPHRDALGPRLWRRDRQENTAENIALARDLRAVCDEFQEPERILLGEVFGDSALLRRYLGDDDGLHLTFLFEFLTYRYAAPWFRDTLQKFERDFAAPLQPTYVLENHDRSRTIDRVGGDVRKAKVLAVLQLTARGVATLYMGQEIGMANTYLPLRGALDPIARDLFAWLPEWVSRRLAERLNRDEVRTPMQWSAAPNAGFCPPEATPWLPVNPASASCNVAAQERDEHGLLSLYRRLLSLRATRDALRTGDVRVDHGGGDSVLTIHRRSAHEHLTVVANLSDAAADVPLGGEALLSTDPASVVTPNTCALAPHSAVVLRRNGCGA
jgi:glycosidase